MDNKLLKIVFSTTILLHTGLFAGGCLLDQKKDLFSPCEITQPGNPLENNQCPAGYNLSASTQLSNQSMWFKDLFIDVSYTYWWAGEDGLELGRSGNFLLGDDPFYTSNTTLLSQPFQYQSGLKIGAGWEKNEWVLSGEYTWVRNQTSQNSSAPMLNPDLGTGVWLIAPWFLQLASDGGSLSGTQIASKWHLGMDIADLALSRPYYQGRHLTILPFGGLRAAWIRQTMNITLTETPGIFDPNPSISIQSLTGSHSWSIGPRFGTKAHVLLGAGLRLEGDIAFSLLFTEYTKIFHQEEAATIDDFPGNLSMQFKNQKALRPVLETGLGLGWGSYLCDNKYHIDFSIDYDFMYWARQNMMRDTLNLLWNEVSSAEDLYLHGLTLTGRFDF